MVKENFKQEYLRSRAYVCLSLSSSSSSCDISSIFVDYQDTRASILDPCIQGILYIANHFVR